VYAFTSTESMYSGSQAFVSADAYAYSLMELTFSLTGWTPVQLFTSTYYDNANLTLWRDGKFVLDSSNLYGLGTFSTTLAPGNYTLIGEAIYGGADLTIQAAPEPASLAALGLGLLALKRRRR
ncbi:PEP-CTERM sorting domain-containing protein, partial [bacterium]